MADSTLAALTAASTMGAADLIYIDQGPGADRKAVLGNIPVNLLNGTTPLSVAKGGTGAATLTGVVKGNGTSALTVSKVAITEPATSATLTIVDGATLTASATATVSGTNTGDQTTVSGNAGTATALATARAIYGNDFDGTAALTQIIASTYGGTGNGFAKFSGPTTSEKTFTLPDASATLVTTTATQTLTNKRTTLRIGTTTSSATPTADADAHDQYNITALATGATLAAPSGTPTDGQRLVFRIKDNGSSQTLAYNSIFRFSSDLAAITATTISKTIYMGCIYNGADTKWDVVALLNNL